MGRFYETTFGVYFDDLDLFGILHNARYLLLFERAIGEFWGHLGLGGLGEAASSPDWHHLVRANSIEYLSPVEGVGEVRVRLSVEKLGRTSLVFALRVMPMDEDRDHAVGTRVLVSVDRENRRPTPWTDGFRERLAPYLAAD